MSYVTERHERGCDGRIVVKSVVKSRSQNEALSRSAARRRRLCRPGTPVRGARHPRPPSPRWHPPPPWHRARARRTDRSYARTPSARSLDVHHRSSSVSVRATQTAAAAAADDTWSHTPSDARTTHRGASTPCVPGWRMSVTVSPASGSRPRAPTCPRTPETRRAPRLGVGLSHTRCGPRTEEAVARALDAPRPCVRSARARRGDPACGPRTGQETGQRSRFAKRKTRNRAEGFGAPRKARRGCPRDVAEQRLAAPDDHDARAPRLSCSTLPPRRRSAVRLGERGDHRVLERVERDLRVRGRRPRRGAAREMRIFAGDDRETAAPRPPWPSSPPRSRRIF